MEDEPPDDGDERNFRLPVLALGRCMVPCGGDPDEGCVECARTHYNWFARISEDGTEYRVNDCSRYQTTTGWKVIEGELRTDVKQMQTRGNRLSDYERWMLEKKRDFLSAYDSAHTRRKPIDQPLDVFLAEHPIGTPV